jgi:glycerol-3-phosphate acyltransferase PlsY
MTPARAWFSANGSIMACWVAMRRIQRSDLMDMGRQYIGATDTYATRFG